MKYTILLLLFNCAAWGQRLTFNEQLVDTIEIVSSEGYYHFDTKGTSTAKSDRYIIVFDSIRNRYVVLDYKRVFDKWTTTPESSEKKEEHFKKYKGLSVNQNSLYSLIKAFSTPYIKPTYANIGLTKEHFLYLTNRKHIHKIAKTEKFANLGLIFSDKIEKKQVFGGCQNIDTFNLFLSSNQFDTSNYPMKLFKVDVIKLQ